ncbi:MAG: hypothetical protein NT047_15220 [Deltaproteobacteria bacterium]|nr:hypothetical protein [Deltaproteobacteria bacterium]
MGGLLPKRPSVAFPSSFAVQRTRKYASRLRISGALHLGIFEQPAKEIFYRFLSEKAETAWGRVFAFLSVPAAGLIAGVGLCRQSCEGNQGGDQWLKRKVRRPPSASG